MSIDNVLYRAYAEATGGREGRAISSDGVLDVELTTPKELGGNGARGTNPEQLFAAGWSACFEGALGLAARRKKIALPANLAIDAEVELCQGEEGYFLRARLQVSLPGLERDAALDLIETAHQTCPYSKATRGNIDVALSLA